MKRIRFQLAFLATAAISALVMCGCSGGGKSAGSTPAAAGTTSPEESFELIVATFRRGVEDIPIGFVVRREGGHSMMSGRNEVSHELIPPAKKGAAYRGIITVDSEWKYSVQDSTKEAEETDREESSKDEGSSVLDEPGDPGSIEILDPELVRSSSSNSESSASSAGATDRKVTRHPDEKVRNYELVYENGRWELVTKLDPDTEQSIANAFEKALKTQI